MILRQVCAVIPGHTAGGFLNAGVTKPRAGSGQHRINGQAVILSQGVECFLPHANDTTMSTSLTVRICRTVLNAPLWPPVCLPSFVFSDVNPLYCCIQVNFAWCEPRPG